MGVDVDLYFVGALIFISYILPISIEAQTGYGGPRNFLSKLGSTVEGFRLWFVNNYKKIRFVNSTILAIALLLLYYSMNHNNNPPAHVSIMVLCVSFLLNILGATWPLWILRK